MAACVCVCVKGRGYKFSELYRYTEVYRGMERYLTARVSCPAEVALGLRR